MTDLQDKFAIFVRSAFAEDRRRELYDFIWKNYGQRVTYYIAQIVPRDHDNFEDLFQEVMLKIYNNLHTFNPLRSFKAWVFRICRCQCLDFLKSKEEKRSSLRDSQPDRVAAATDPERQALRDEMLRAIDRFMAGLGGLDREMCYLRFYETLRYREIARIVGMNVNSVKSRIRQVKARLREHLAAE